MICVADTGERPDYWRAAGFIPAVPKWFAAIAGILENLRRVFRNIVLPWRGEPSDGNMTPTTRTGKAMPQPSSSNPLPLPTWVMVVCSVAVAGHLLIIAASVLAAPSGRWPTPYGRDTARGPEFAMIIDEVTRPKYLRPLKLTHNYHFATNEFAMMYGLYLEVRLKNEAGEVTQTLRIPEQIANPWVRHRQELLVHNLFPDQPLPPPAGEVLPAPGQRAPTVQYWRPGPDGVSRLHTEPQHLVPRNAELYQPSELSLMLARSYARHLCLREGAASAEIIRHSRMPLSPIVLIQREVPPEATEELVASFGEMSR